MMKHYDILELIPQRPPFTMVDDLIHFDEESGIATFLIRADNLMLEDGELSEAGAMENMAQACAAWIGYYNKMNNQSVKIGVIGAMKDVHVHRLPKVGDTIKTEIRKTMDTFYNNMMLFDAKITMEDHVIVDGILKVAVLDS